MAGSLQVDRAGVGGKESEEPAGSATTAPFLCAEASPHNIFPIFLLSACSCARMPRGCVRKWPGRTHCLHRRTPHSFNSGLRGKAEGHGRLSGQQHMAMQKPAG